MAPHWKQMPFPPPLQGPLIMDAVLRPHRSLSLAGFRLMLGLVIAVNAILAAAFVARGAFPVAGLLGLDVLALWLGFRWNYDSARIEERVRISAAGVHVMSIGQRGEAKHWALNPIWARVIREGQGVLIRAGASQMRLGAFLSPRECDGLAAALDDAMRRARAGGR